MANSSSVFPWQNLPFMPLLDITPLKKTSLKSAIRPPPSADARLLRDLKEQVTVLQKDISQQAQNDSGRRMVIQIPKKHVGLEYFLPRFFHSFNLHSTYNGLDKKRGV